jgi:hypothetical protein
VSEEQSNTQPHHHPVPDLVLVIDRAALLEHLINQIICAYCAPRKEAWMFMTSIVLDTSVMSLGAKTKVVMAVAQQVDYKLDKNSIHTAIALRNSFAHNAHDANRVVEVGVTEEAYYHEFWILQSSGRLDKKKRHEALKEFNEAYTKARRSLIGLVMRVADKVSAPT